MELGYQKAEDSVHFEGWRDNWIRTFRKTELPTFSPEEKKMVQKFVSDGEYTKLAIYLTDERFGYSLDSDTAEFVIREFIRGTYV